MASPVYANGLNSFRDKFFFCSIWELDLVMHQPSVGDNAPASQFFHWKAPSIRNVDNVANIFVPIPTHLSIER